MLSKLDFVNYLCELKEYHETCIKISVASNGSINLYDATELVDVTVDLLQRAMRDKNDWIIYWMYELDFGKDYRPGCVTAEDGSDIPLQTFDDVYDVLASEYDENGSDDEND